MKFWHFYCIKSPLMLVAYLFGSLDINFLIVAGLSLVAAAIFAYAGE